mmetsp:Transcript_41666/g.107839  ORF Transcript_41666/g.107839 Transcript_41666/m.107839 type:complete len:441 (-) Transcript_41666:114-1436(-)
MPGKEAAPQESDVEAEARPLSGCKSFGVGPYTWLQVATPPSSPRPRTWKDYIVHMLCGIRYRGPDEDTMTYQISDLSSWQAFCMWEGSAWDNHSLWLTIYRTCLVATCVALVVCFGTPDPTKVRSEKFSKLSTFLSVFVGLLLSFFMASSMNRWYSCVSSFLELFDAVRNLQMQCHALGVPMEREVMLTRYGCLSSWLLHYELILQSRCIAKEDQLVEMQKVWDHHLPVDHPGLCLPEEQALLQQCEFPSQMVWTWVASLVGRMAQDGDIPAMPTPTYGRILNIVSEAHGGIRGVRAAVCVQAPYIYIHTLAVLVHFNNVINAVAFGMTAGVTLGKFTVHDVISNRDFTRMAAKEGQNMVIAFFLSMVGPFLYQALLEVSVCIAQPFNNDDAMIPTARLLKSLERDLYMSDELAKRPPFWEPPHFRQAAPSKGAAAPPPA